MSRAERLQRMIDDIRRDIVATIQNHYDARWLSAWHEEQNARIELLEYVAAGLVPSMTAMRDRPPASTPEERDRHA